MRKKIFFLIFNENFEKLFHFYELEGAYFEIGVIVAFPSERSFNLIPGAFYYAPTKQPGLFC